MRNLIVLALISKAFTCTVIEHERSNEGVVKSTGFNNVKIWVGETDGAPDCLYQQFSVDPKNPLIKSTTPITTTQPANPPYWIEMVWYATRPFKIGDRIGGEFGVIGTQWSLTYIDNVTNTYNLNGTYVKIDGSFSTELAPMSYRTFEIPYFNGMGSTVYGTLIIE